MASYINLDTETPRFFFSSRSASRTDGVTCTPTNTSLSVRIMALRLRFMSPFRCHHHHQFYRLNAPLDLSAIDTGWSTDTGWTGTQSTAARSIDDGRWPELNRLMDEGSESNRHILRPRTGIKSIAAALSRAHVPNSRSCLRLDANQSSTFAVTCVSPSTPHLPRTLTLKSSHGFYSLSTPKWQRRIGCDILCWQFIAEL